MKDQFPTFRALGKRIADLVTNKRLTRRLGSAFIKTCKVVGVLIIAVMIVHTILMIVWGRQLARRLDELRASGIPVYSAELAPKNLPTSKNGGLLYEKAMRLVGNNGDYYRSHDDWSHDCGLFDDFTKSMPGSVERQKMLPAVEDALSRRAGLLSILIEAASKPECRFTTIKWEQGAGALFPQLGNIRNFTRMCVAKAQVDAIKGDMNAATRDIILALRVSQATKDEPITIGALVSYACLQIATDGLAEITKTHTFTVEQALRITRELSRIELDPSFTNALNGESAITNTTFDMMRYDTARFWDMIYLNENMYRKSGLKKAGIAIVVYLWRPLSYKDQIVCLDMWKKQMELIEQPYRIGVGKYHSLDIINRLPRYALLTRIFFPMCTGVVAVRDTADARIGIAKTALALETYRSEFGSYPESLTQLHKTFATDPFSGKNFVYKRMGNTFMLYSIGRNLKDDGGLSKENPNKDEPDDIVWGRHIQ
ncbi:hypothetical protein LLG46_06855 [bacterium]|nr:hypothetical protein [bacterium]